MIKTKLTVIAGALLLQTGVMAQIYVKNPGNVGVGISTPTAKLQVADAGNASFRVGITSNMSNTYAQVLNSLAVLGNDNNTTSSCGAVSWDFYNNGNNPTWSGALLQHVGTNVTGTKNGLQAANQGTLLFQNVSNGAIASNGANIFIYPANNLAASFLSNGNVGIGTTSPTYRLHVIGSARATSFISDTKTYADYVFAPGYQLPSLQEVAAYIKQNHHLPEVPSEEDVKKDGINLAEHQVILLKKVEELTLYVIEQNEKLNEVLNANKKLQEEIKTLKEKAQAAAR